MVDQHLVGDEEISSWVKKSKTIDSMIKLPGDASTRRYYRVRAGKQSYIVMKMEPFEAQGDRLPFLGVQKILKDFGVDVPAVYETDSRRGFLLLEDLGDVTFLKMLQKVATPEKERELYERVLDTLITLQSIPLPPQSILGLKGPQGLKVNSKRSTKNLSGARKLKSSEDDFIPEVYRLRFDQEKLMWEVDFAIEHFYQSYLKRQFIEKDLRTMRKGFSEICELLSSQPCVLTHRDFHSRNVMVIDKKGSTPSRFVMIDFQDARLGPAQYDLASLLRDSYYQLDEDQIYHLLDYYLEHMGAVGRKKINRAEFIRVFDLMSVQRNFKAIGSFASFLNRRGDPTYLKYIGNTFENIRRTLGKYKEYTGLKEILYQYYYF